ncbi:TolC family protein [Sphingobacterium sp. KU25419]|nr:TolC family protein [Sphingobacterium sp. KU25419]
MQRTILEFQFILQTRDPLLPKKDPIKIKPQIEKQSNLEQHPELQTLAYEIETRKSETKLESSKLLPTVNAGWYTQSMKEISSNRFNVAQIGIGLPIFTKGQRNLAKAAKTQEIVAQGNYDLKLKENNNKKQQWQMQFINRLAVVERFEQSQLKKQPK